MTSAIIANAIVNLCAVIGLVVAMLALHRRDARSPVTGRFLIALGIVALLFLVRSTAWLTGSSLLDDLSVIPAAAIPFGALIVTEGMLRRHAPRAVKLAGLIGAVVLGIGGALGLERFDTPYAVALALFQLGGFAACAFLLATRDRRSLMASENRSIERMTIGAIIVLPFIVTDFGALMPNMPVKLGALGALLVVTAILIAGGSDQARSHGVLLSVLRLVSSACLGLAAAFVVPDVDAAQVARFCAISVSGVLAIGLMTDTLRSYLESRVPGVLSSVAISPASSRDQLIAELLSAAAAQPPRGSSRAAARGCALGPSAGRSGGGAAGFVDGGRPCDASRRAVVRPGRYYRARGSRDVGRSRDRDRDCAGAADPDHDR